MDNETESKVPFPTKSYIYGQLMGFPWASGNEPACQ